MGILLDITWGETFLLTGLGFALIGRKDLPKAAYFLGSQIGRVVGFLQGVRVRADRFAQNHELRALHNELRSGLRELDVVRLELATAASSRGLVGRGLHSPSQVGLIPTDNTTSSSSYSQQRVTNYQPETSPMGPNASNIKHTDQNVEQREEDPILPQLAPRSQSIAAVAEAEWEKQGIGFRSKAEMGRSSNSPVFNAPQGNIRFTSGSMLLAHILQESLIFDQYDRTVREQDQALQKKIDHNITDRTI